MVRRQISEQITSAISIAWYFTTKSGGIWLNLPQLAGESPRPPLFQVGSRAGEPAVGGGFPAPLFRLRDGCTLPPWPRFQPPPRQTQRADVGIEMRRAQR